MRGDAEVAPLRQPTLAGDLVTLRPLRPDDFDALYAVARDPIRSEVEIGCTFLARSHWGGRYNGEMKRLMLAHAFAVVKRVVFVIGSHNRRSQLAIEKIGGRRAGTPTGCHHSSRGSADFYGIKT